MLKHAWTLWIIPVALWGLFSCWHCGYQSGYADGHVTAWKMYQPQPLHDNQIAAAPDVEEPSESEITR